VFGWAGLARLIRNQARSLVAREFVEAIRSVGSSGLHVVFYLPPYAPYPNMVIVGRGK
jgi:ABC-type dipeptide/oligopeptide/nickel transport system permease subunit